LTVEQAGRFLCSYGFSGVLLARRMVANADEMEHAWTQALETLPLLSNDGDHAFLDLRPFCTNHNSAILDLEQMKHDLLAARERGIHFLNPLVFWRMIGHVEAQAGEGTSVVGTADEDGYLAFGPYETLNPGHYTAAFTLAIREAPASASPLSIDVVAGIGGQNASIHLASRPIVKTDEGTRIEVPFSVSHQTEKVEYRIYKPRGYVVQFKGVQITRDITL
jgi:hypothetical protein